MWGLIPAAGIGSRIQPLAFSKELLPVGSRLESGTERPRAVSEYLVERMLTGGATKLCFVIAPGKSDILEYFGAKQIQSASLSFVVQPTPAGLCDALFRAAPIIPADDEVVIGLPDTIWFPENGLCSLPSGILSFLLFPVRQPDLFDAVVTDSSGAVQEIQVKQALPSSTWIWGAFKMPGHVFQALHELWLRRERRDEYVGTLVNAWLNQGGKALGIRTGEAYVDVGTLNGYREALALLSKINRTSTPPHPVHVEASLSQLLYL